MILEGSMLLWRSFLHYVVSSIMRGLNGGQKSVFATSAWHLLGEYAGDDISWHFERCREDRGVEVNMDLGIVFLGHVKM